MRVVGSLRALVVVGLVCGAWGESTRRHLLLRVSSLTRGGSEVAPINGAAFLKAQELPSLPSVLDDAADPFLMVTRQMPNKVNKAGADACRKKNDGIVSKGECLSTVDRECMWVELEGIDPTAPIQAVESHCLPCEVDEEDVPCYAENAVVGGMRVKTCEMRCPHQKRLRQPEYACSDESGFITQAQCFDKGARSNSKCMFVAYKNEAGEDKSMCGPCFVSGTGGFGCPAIGGAGPETGSSVNFCLSQCDVICAGPPACPPTVAPPPPPPPPSPGVVQTEIDNPRDMVRAPGPYAMPTVNPFAIAYAASAAAKAAGFVIGTAPPPKSYYPVVMYRKPSIAAMMR